MFARRVSVATLGWLLAAFTVVACGDDESEMAEVTTDDFPYLTGSYEPNCTGYIGRLRDCGILGEGPFTCAEPVTEQDVCAYQCAAIASCGILSDLVCRGVQAFPLESCFIECNSFKCDSGDSIASNWVCDGQVDCQDGSDEEACFLCDSGESVPPRVVCDFYPHCLDASDEQGCDGFRCESGETIAKSRECDRQADCLDGSDEADCEVFVCEVTSENVPAHWRCDGEEDCLDGSDEKGCAPLTCP